MKLRQFYSKSSAKNDITQADFLDRSKPESWEVIGSQSILLILLELHKNVNLEDVSAVCT